ncbi:flagellar basal body rod protein FlgB [Xylophilus rhododendri]|uniref:Flagellar basal body rod protein FlgB n=1 Tax=Xylophilus rhododendri TaxID=2697032 RepID=A0A857J4M2_9BURK|nr:flagellar basal body protein [Xylophilus rhododendri]QHI97981.1 flagellar basal body rod protein FlgB [Xylophilus rhododendri]
MLETLTNQLDFQSKALVLRAERQRVLASNIANADTPGYAARDMDFASNLRAATGEFTGGSGQRLPMTASSGSAIGSVGGMPTIGLATGDLGRGGFMPVSTVGRLPGGSGAGELGYAVQTQPSMDGNSVDLDRERATFADNAVHYEATLRFINGQAKTLLTAIQGQ